MSQTLHELGIDRMSAEDRLRLLEEIWESLSPPQQMEIPETHRQELDRRLAAADANPDASSPWTEARTRLLGDK